MFSILFILKNSPHVNHLSDKDLTSRLYEDYNSTAKNKREIQFKKWAEELNFCEEDTPLRTASGRRERCPTSLIVREVPIKAAVRGLLAPSGWVWPEC